MHFPCVLLDFNVIVLYIFLFMYVSLFVVIMGCRFCGCCGNLSLVKHTSSSYRYAAKFPLACIAGVYLFVAVIFDYVWVCMWAVVGHP